MLAGKCVSQKSELVRVSPFCDHRRDQVSSTKPGVLSFPAVGLRCKQQLKTRTKAKGLRCQEMSSRTLEKSANNVAAKDYCEESVLSNPYESAMEALSSLITGQKRGHGSVRGKYGKLDRMRMYLKILDLEEDIAGLKIIHVAGTKGKGSTCTFCESILRECGFRTGLFTSPHLIDVRERFRLDGLDISEEKFLVYFWDCWNRLKEHETADLPMPPLFQFLTVMAFKIFVRELVDVAIIEVGLGGQKDSTNVINEPVVCGITSLGMDHTEVLGDTLGQIALHKAGIFKHQIPAFTAPQLSEAMDVLRERAQDLQVPLKVAEPLDVSKFEGLKLSLLGEHQFTNAGLAVSLCKSWLERTGNWNEAIENKGNQETGLPEAFCRGLSTAHLSGRGQIVHDYFSDSHSSAQPVDRSSGGLVFYLDGAHSPESMEACAKWFSSTVQGNKQRSPSFSPTSYVGQSVKHSGRNGSIQRESERSKDSAELSKKILLFNCMEVRDPEVLLPRLVSTCAASGTYFSKAIFVPSMSTYSKVTSGQSAIPHDFTSKDLSWQINLQRIWERIIHGRDIDGLLDKNRKLCRDILPPQDFLHEDASHCSSAERYFSCSTVLPSLPLTIKWLRDCARENPSVTIQVLVTGSLHLVGDVLKILRR